MVDEEGVEEVKSCLDTELRLLFKGEGREEGNGEDVEEVEEEEGGGRGGDRKDVCVTGLT